MIDSTVQFLTSLLGQLAPVIFIWVMVDKALRCIIAATTGRGKGLDE